MSRASYPILQRPSAYGRHAVAPLPEAGGCDVIASLPRHPKLTSTFALLHRPLADLHFCTSDSFDNRPYPLAPSRLRRVLASLVNWPTGQRIN